MASVIQIENKQFFNRPIWLTGETLTGATNLGQSGAGSNGNKGVFHTPQISRIGASDAVSCHIQDMEWANKDFCFSYRKNKQKCSNEYETKYTFILRIVCVGGSNKCTNRNTHPQVCFLVAGPKSTYIPSLSPNHMPRSLLPRKGFEASLSNNVMRSAPGGKKKKKIIKFF